MTLAVKGIDVRQSTTQITIRASLKTSAGLDVTAGTIVARLYALVSDGSLLSYDFADNTFKATALGTETLALTERTGNNGGTHTGIWTAAITTLTGFTVGGVYIVKVTDATGTPTASPVSQEREFQYGGDQGDQVAQTIVQTKDAGGNVTVGGYAAGQDPKTILEATGSKLDKVHTATGASAGIAAGVSGGLVTTDVSTGLAPDTPNTDAIIAALGTIVAVDSATSLTLAPHAGSNGIWTLGTTITVTVYQYVRPSGLSVGVIDTGVVTTYEWQVGDGTKQLNVASVSNGTCDGVLFHLTGTTSNGAYETWFLGASGSYSCNLKGSEAAAAKPWGTVQSPFLLTAAFRAVDMDGTALASAAALAQARLDILDDVLLYFPEQFSTMIITAGQTIGTSTYAGGAADAAAATVLAQANKIGTNDGDSTNAKTAQTSIAAILLKFTGITFLAKWLGMIMGSGSDGVTLSEVQQTVAAATYDNTLKSLEAHVDGAGGGGGLNAQQTRDAMKLAPSAGAAAAGSIDALLATVISTGGALSPTQASQLSAIAAAVLSTPIVVKRNVNAAGELELSTGDDYTGGSAVLFGVVSGFADLSGSTPTLDITPTAGNLPSPSPILTATGTLETGSQVINGVTYTQWISVPLTETQTASLTNWNPSAYRYRVLAVWTSPAKKIHVKTGSCTAMW